MPENLDYAELRGLSNEVRQKLKSPAPHHRPGRPHRRHDAGGVDAARRASQAQADRRPAVDERSTKTASLGDAMLLRRQGPSAVTDRSFQLDLEADRARALALTPVSRETSERLDRFVELLLTWQRTTNLIAPSTIPHLWTRHIADSLQLLELAPGCADLDRSRIGRRLSRPRHRLRAGGQPGADGPSGREQRQEGRIPARGSARHRCAGRCPRRADRGIREALRRVRLDVVTARAVAPLKLLLEQCFPLLGKSGATGLFPKGQDAELELTRPGLPRDLEHECNAGAQPHRAGRPHRRCPGCGARAGQQP